MTPDWSALEPHRPLAAGSAQYVAPPSHWGQEIADRVIAGQKLLLIGGPAGIGKSTELARAAALLRGKGDRIAFVAPIDVWEDMRRLTPDQLLLRLAGLTAHIAIQQKLALNPELVAALVHAGVLNPAMLEGQYTDGFHHASPRVLANAVLDEVKRLSTQGRITLLIDGMEKIPNTPTSEELFQALATLPDHVEQVVVVPWHAAYGTHGETIRPGERWMILQPDPTEGAAGRPTRKFLAKILARRLSLDPRRPVAEAPSFRALVDEAAMQSGGLPRMFLQLVADAGTYARLQGREWPDMDDLDDAIADLEDSFRRALLPGDTDAAIDAEDTDGREMEPERKIRLLSRGVLLERKANGRTTLVIHPLARGPIEEGADA